MRNEPPDNSFGIVGATSAPPLSHRSLWRRLRRRFPILPLWAWLIALPAIAPWMAALALAEPSMPGWVATLARWLWLVTGLAFLAIPVFFLLVMREHTSVVPTLRKNMALSLVGQVATVVCLVAGRLDWAIYAQSGWSILWTAIAVAQKQSKVRFASLVENLCVLSGVVAREVWLVLLGAAVSLLDSFYLRKRIFTVLKTKPARETYVTQKQAACAAGGG
jgi:hypothetical protein